MARPAVVMPPVAVGARLAAAPLAAPARVAGPARVVGPAVVGVELAGVAGEQAAAGQLVLAARGARVSGAAPARLEAQGRLLVRTRLGAAQVRAAAVLTVVTGAAGRTADSADQLARASRQGGLVARPVAGQDQADRRAPAAGRCATIASAVGPPAAGRALGATATAARTATRAGVAAMATAKMARLVTAARVASVRHPAGQTGRRAADLAGPRSEAATAAP